MSVPVSEIATILMIIKEGVEWANEQKKLGNISQEDFDKIFERIEVKENTWGDLAPDDNE